jgi:hypothetical protein
MTEVSQSTVAIITALATAFSAIAVAMSSVVLFLSYQYNRRLSRARIAPVETGTNVSVSGQDINFTLSLQFKNVGLEEATGLNAEAFAFDTYRGQSFSNPNLELTSPVYKEQDFVIPVEFSVQTSQTLNNSNVTDFVQKFGERHGPLILAVLISYNTQTTSGIFGQYEQKQIFLFEYNGGEKVGFCPKHRFDIHKEEFPCRFRV